MNGKIILNLAIGLDGYIADKDGGILIDSFVRADIIDEYVIGIIPTILGEGRKLFLENNPKIDLKLEYYAVEDGVIVMKYSKRNK